MVGIVAQQADQVLVVLIQLPQHVIDQLGFGLARVADAFDQPLMGDGLNGWQLPQHRPAGRGVGIDAIPAPAEEDSLAGKLRCRTPPGGRIGHGLFRLATPRGRFLRQRAVRRGVHGKGRQTRWGWVGVRRAGRFGAPILSYRAGSPATFVFHGWFARLLLGALPGQSSPSKPIAFVNRRTPALPRQRCGGFRRACGRNGRMPTSRRPRRARSPRTDDALPSGFDRACPR